MKQVTFTTQLEGGIQGIINTEDIPNSTFLPGYDDDQALRNAGFEPGILGICVTPLPELDEGTVLCSKEEATQVCFWSAHAHSTRWMDLEAFRARGYSDSWPIFAYAKKKPETREEYLRRTVPEGYEWLGSGLSHVGKFKHAFTGRLLLKSDTSNWDMQIDNNYYGDCPTAYYIRKIEQPKPEFNPQVGSWWKHEDGALYSLEETTDGKYMLLSQDRFYLFAGATHCPKDAFAGRENQFEYVRG